MVRRRCVVCGRHVRRSDWRVTRVEVGGPLEVTLRGFASWVRSGVAHRACMLPTDGQLAQFVGRPR